MVLLALHVSLGSDRIRRQCCPSKAYSMCTLPSGLVPKYHAMASPSRDIDRQLLCRPFRTLGLSPLTGQSTIAEFEPDIEDPE